MRLTIEKLVYGGSGLARTDRGVVFVPRTAPGDVVEAELVDQKSDYAVARLTSLVEPSPDRQTATCPNYATAGCCHWQHIRYTRQLEIKESILRETLQRTAHLSWGNPIPALSGPDTHYRLRASFHVFRHKLGFIEDRSHTIVPVSECSALSPELNAFIPEGDQILRRPEMSDIREVHAISGPPVLAAFGRECIGQGPSRVQVNDWIFDLHPLAFFQTNRYLLGDFLQQVLVQAAGARRVLDLFCGSAFFSVPLARQSGEVLGVEASRTAVKQARLNAKLNGVTNIKIFEGPVEEALRNSPDLHPDLIVMNPPRAGAGRDVARLVAGLGAHRIIYVSCNPSTFGRETPMLTEKGYSLRGITMVDQFPNTHHIEMVAVFEK
jgi:23S rRNA (uracil1939-C5)-methyltransferase